MNQNVRPATTVRLVMCAALVALIANPVQAQTTPPTAPASGGQPYITTEASGVWPASKLIGLNVYNQGGDKVGDVNEVLVDRSGSIQAVVIGVGGFLGIGERNVAVPFGALQWVMTPLATNSANTAGPNVGTLAAPTTMGAVSSNPDRTYPDHAVLPNASRDQLKSAPEFHYTGAR